MARRARSRGPAAWGRNHGSWRARVLHERLGEAGRGCETVRRGPQGGFGVEQARLAFADAEGVPHREHAPVVDGTAPRGRRGLAGGAGVGPRGRATQGRGGARRRRRGGAEGRHRRREEPCRRRRRRRRRRLPRRAHRARAPAEGPAAEGHRPDGARGDHDGDVQARASVPGAKHREGQAEGGGAQEGGRARGRGAAEAGGDPRRAPAPAHGGHSGAPALRDGFGFPQRGQRRVPRARAHRPRAARRRRLRGDHARDALRDAPRAEAVRRGRAGRRVDQRGGRQGSRGAFRARRHGDSSSHALGSPRAGGGHRVRARGLRAGPRRAGGPEEAREVPRGGGPRGDAPRRERRGPGERE
mmetsp:Transcript_4585/g.19553  ORF Transcript_4585/g.19553 Transcript_4585/m.19553 type:complete len:357 (-) Transcript_4585:1455-2525(-)